MVEVTESAKAAIDLLTKIEEYDHACDCDDCNSLRTHTLPFVVQAFATHRIEAAKAERDRIVAWLREAQVEAMKQRKLEASAAMTGFADALESQP
jgi:hypothetical protein